MKAKIGKKRKELCIQRMLSSFVNAEFTCFQKAAIAVGELHPFRSKHKSRKERRAPFRSSGSERVMMPTFKVKVDNCRRNLLNA